jgi:hypothetical protein
MRSRGKAKHKSHACRCDHRTSSADKTRDGGVTSYYYPMRACVLSAKTPGQVWIAGRAVGVNPGDRGAARA